MRRWKHWETETRTAEYQFSHGKHWPINYRCMSKKIMTYNEHDHKTCYKKIMAYLLLVRYLLWKWISHIKISICYERLFSFSFLNLYYMLCDHQSALQHIYFIYACTDPERFRFARDTSFGRRHLSFWTKTPTLMWIVRSNI